MDSVIVTGGSRGLGLAIARRLAADGFAVTAVARTTTPDLEAAIAAAPAEALRFEPCDLADIAALPALVRRVRAARPGPLYGLVNNAGGGTAGVLANMAVADMEALLRLNTLAPMVLTKHAVRSMMTAGRGRIVNMASIVAATGSSGLSVYGATKAALVGFTKSLAREVGPLGITVNAVAPGFVDTAMTAGLSETDRARVAARTALRRLPEADEVAATVAFLLSPGAGGVTGSVVTVDAGATA